MKRLIYVIYLLVFSLPAHSDEIDWERASFGITANYQVPFGDFGTYWNNGPGAGGLARYKVLDRVYLMGTLTVNYYSPVSNTDGKNIPHIWLVNMSGSIHYEIPINSRLTGLVGIGGDNFTFIFRGTPTEDISTNTIESEVALHGEIGLSFRFQRLPVFDLFTRYSSIFSFPDQIPIWVTGLYIYF